ncbi:MAG: I78 family peptidase inhibitor [Candidatus Eremiobacteraeota bacterium]|nr:I78 family peptidase inhibitor [Candidatus Eremiobacteraeota bacterium]
MLTIALSLALASVDCNASATGFAIGKHYTTSLGERVRKAANARTVRELLPGRIYTMEFMFGRINVELDRHGRVRRVSCG